MHRGRTNDPFTWLAAFGALVLGHWIAYMATVPGAGAREALLAQTGHGYWPTAVALAVVFGGAAFAGTAVRHLLIGARRPTAPSSPWERYRSSALRLAGLQAAVFVVQEVVERLQAGAPVGGLLHGGFLAVGIAVQILLAAFLAFVLTGLARAAEAVGRALAADARVRRERARPLFPARIMPASAATRGPRRTRAPPVRIAATC